MEPDYVAHNVAEFQRTGFHGALNYYRAAEPYFYLSAAWKGAKITQPSFYISGKADGLGALYPPSEKLHAGLPGLIGNLELDNVGHWVQHEASAEVSEQLVKFLRTVQSSLKDSRWQHPSHSPTHTFRSPRHTTHYWEAGLADGPLMFFLHGWPEIGLVWRAQIEAFASEGWHCIAPDMRGYGGSSAPSASEAYALKEIVDDMVELHDHLGAAQQSGSAMTWEAPWPGRWPHITRSEVVASCLISVPYSPEAFALPSLLPLIDRKLYPADQYPDGQWDYYRFYLTHFDQTVTDFDADIPRASRRYSEWEPRVRRQGLPVRLGHAQWGLVRFGASRTEDAARSSALAAADFEAPRSNRSA